jgi:hypothetical protein
LVVAHCSEQQEVVAEGRRLVVQADHLALVVLVALLRERRLLPTLVPVVVAVHLALLVLVVQALCM